VTGRDAYEGLYHEILNEPEQDLVLDEVCSWLGARVGAVTA
jgi:alpha-beta hydrolase superfamily lysophospholipase